MAKRKPTDEKVWTFQYRSEDGEPGRFVCHDREGGEVVIETGEGFATEDPHIAAYLRTVPWVEEV